MVALALLSSCVLWFASATTSLAVVDSWRPDNVADISFSASPMTRWADAALNFVRNLSCEEDVFLATREECHQVKLQPQSDFNVYAAEPTSEGRLVAVLPDGALSRSGAHDAVLVLDPYPRANLGHLLVVFFVDVGWTELRCSVNGGKYLGDHHCMSLALKNRCHNLLEGKVKLHNSARRCEINFFPLVHLEEDRPSQQGQRLRCRDDLGGFAPCPQLRPENETRGLICDPLHVNTQRCSTTHETVHTRCRIFETCDQAVLLSGGWDRLTSAPRYKANLAAVYHMLRDNGFRKGNIKIFYANGASDLVDGEEHHSMYPSAFKLALRYHLRKLCQSSRCVDSLVLYLNSPTRNDGSSLLWDIDGNGQVDENEVYTVKELLVDLQDCAAHQVNIIADQSYSGELTRSFSLSSRHNNVLVFVSSREHEFSWEGEFTRHWVNFHHAHTCVGRVHEASQHAVRFSNPTVHDGSKGTIKKTIFGAPCDVVPPFTQRELQSYFGCQNVPTSVWIS